MVSHGVAQQVTTITIVRMSPGPGHALGNLKMNSLRVERPLEHVCEESGTSGLDSATYASWTCGRNASTRPGEFWEGDDGEVHVQVP